MKALLLAAGMGTRLRPITNTIPKCLVEIKGRPLLDYWLELLVDNGIYEILINTHYLHEKVFEYIHKHKYNKYITTVYEENLFGTGGTVLRNKGFFKNDSFMVIHADNLSKFDLASFIDSHKNRPKETELTMMLFQTDLPKTCGIVELDQNGVVLKFHEKVENPPGNLANGAVYIFESSIIQFLEKMDKEFIDLSTEVLPFYMNKIYTWENRGYHRDIGNLESLERANKEFISL